MFDWAIEEAELKEKSSSALPLSPSRYKPAASDVYMFDRSARGETPSSLAYAKLHLDARSDVGRSDF